MKTDNSESQLSEVWILDTDDIAQQAYETFLGHICLITPLSSIKELLASLANSTPPELLIAETITDDGDTIAHLKQITFDFPVIFSSSKDCKETMESAYSVGGIDYLIKPVSRNEITIKVKRALARKDDPKGDHTDQGIEIDQSRLRVTVDGTTEQLTPKEMQIVNLLQSSPKTRVEIMEYVWENTNVSRKAFDVHLFHLRRKLARVGVEITLGKKGAYSINRKKFTKDRV